MKLASIQFPCFNPYNKATVEIFVSGCTRNCMNCCNPRLQDFNLGKELDIEDLITWLNERKGLFKAISIVGGDLLCQNEKEALELVFRLKQAFKDKEFWLFTGFDDFEVIPQWCKEQFDYIKYGSYKEELKQDGFPASTNQILWKRKEGIKNDK